MVGFVVSSMISATMPLKPVCRLTHPLLASGTCPWCQQPVLAGQLRPEIPPREAATRRWDVGAMLRALDSPESDVRNMPVSNLLGQGPAVAEETLPVLRKALTHPDRDVRHMAVSVFHMLGIRGRISREDVERLERQVNERPDDPALRLLLLGSLMRLARAIDWAREARLRHGLWVIENFPQGAQVWGPTNGPTPADGPAFEEARRLWLRQAEVRENDPEVLGNAARFFIFHDEPRSEGLLRKAQALEPDNTEWGWQLAHLYSMQAHDRPELWAKALAESENAYRREADEFRRWLMLPELAQAAWDAGEWEKAEQCATELVEKVEKADDRFHRDGRAVFYGHHILGRLALQSGDVARAKAHLLASGRTAGDPCLRTGGPDMHLARDLLERGERDAVVEFLRLCANFWKTDDHRPEQWIYAIEHGEMPDFGRSVR